MENFKEIIKEYHPILYKIGRVYTNDDDFDDLYQEMLIAIWKTLKNFRGDSKISTWLYKVALNTALTYQRKNKFSFFQKSNLDEIENIPFTHENSAIEREASIEALYAAIKQLKSDDRSLVLLYLEEKSYEEMAEILGISTSLVGVKINRVKKKLFKLLNVEA